MRVLILGAGVIGTATALALARRGIAVTVIERHRRPAEETSHANGGAITPGHAEPWNAPGIAGVVLRWLGRRDAPFRLRLRALPGLVRWGPAFLLGSREARFLAHSRANTRLALYSLRCLRELGEAYALDYGQSRLGSLKLFFDEREMRLTRERLARIANPELTVQPLSAMEAVALEPALEPIGAELAGALYYLDNEAGDARRFTLAVAERAREAGARFLFGTEVESLRCEAGGFRAVRTNAGELEADACIVALGNGSAALMRPLGVRLPIYPVKGYSATLALERPQAAPRRPLLDTSRRVIVTPLGEGQLRIAGSAELTGFDVRLDRRRAQAVLDHALALLPALAGELERRAPALWTGLRPMTPDGPPLLGATRYRGLFLNTGHGSLGWTHACGSAEILADLVTGRRPAIDLEGLEAERWR